MVDTPNFPTKGQRLFDEIGEAVDGLRDTFRPAEGRKESEKEYREKWVERNAKALRWMSPAARDELLYRHLSITSMLATFDNASNRDVLFLFRQIVARLSDRLTTSDKVVIDTYFQDILSFREAINSWAEHRPSRMGSIEANHRQFLEENYPLVYGSKTQIFELCSDLMYYEWSFEEKLAILDALRKAISEALESIKYEERPTAPDDLNDEKFRAAAEAKAVGEMFARARENAGISKSAMEREHKIARSALQQFEKGQNSPTLERIQNYADALKMDVHIELVPKDKS